MNRTLPLFQGLEGARPEAHRPEPPAAPAPRRAVTAPRSDSQDRHLRAAWRLSRGMWRYPEHSAEQTRAGLAICRHLQALLAQAQESPPQR